MDRKVGTLIMLVILFVIFNLSLLTIFIDSNASAHSLPQQKESCFVAFTSEGKCSETLQDGKNKTSSADCSVIIDNNVCKGYFNLP